MPREEERETLSPAEVPALAPGAMTVDGLLALQRSVGNHAAARALGRSALPPASLAGSAGPAGELGLERALARAVATRLDRCPDCGGTCGCEEETEEAEDATVTATARGVAPFGKSKGGAHELAGAAPTAAAVVEGDLSGDEPDEPETAELEGAAGEAAQQPVAAPTPPSEVDLEVIDESPEDDVDIDEGPEPQADETEDEELESEEAPTVARSAVNLGLAPPTHSLGSARAYAVFAKASTSIKKGPSSHALGGDMYGLTIPESVDVKFRVKRSGATWVPRVTKLVGRYSMQTRLLPGQSEVTGPRGNTTSTNYCEQLENLTNLGNVDNNPWYMLKAVKKHERVHRKHFIPSLKAVKVQIVTGLEAASVPHVKGMKKSAAMAAIKADPTWQTAVSDAFDLWFAEAATQVAGDHSGPTDAAEHKVVDPMIKAICKTAKRKQKRKKNKWPACAHCP